MKRRRKSDPDLEVDIEVEDDADPDAEADTEAEDDSGDDSDPEPTLNWNFPLTSDSTALNLVTDVIVEDDGDLLGDSDLLDSVEAFTQRRDQV